MARYLGKVSTECAEWRKCLISNVPMMTVSTCWGKLEAMEGSTTQEMPLKEVDWGGLMTICKVMDDMESVVLTSALVRGARSGVSGGRQGRNLLPFAASYIEERRYQITER